jgi:predicted enzyme related to lactoylglutathione lyase
MAAIARLSLFALDGPDHHALAQFYAAITGWTLNEEDAEDGGDWITLENDGGATLAFQRVDNFEPPTWPSGGHPQQAHLDFDVVDLDIGEQQVLALGARKAEFQPGKTFRVFLDPVGHPFCLVLIR